MTGGSEPLSLLAVGPEPQPLRLTSAAIVLDFN